MCNFSGGSSGNTTVANRSIIYSRVFILVIIVVVEAITMAVINEGSNSGS